MSDRRSFDRRSRWLAIMNDEIETIKATITNRSRMNLIGFYSTAKDHVLLNKNATFLKDLYEIYNIYRVINCQKLDYINTQLEILWINIDAICKLHDFCFYYCNRQRCHNGLNSY